MKTKLFRNLLCTTVFLIVFEGGKIFAQELRVGSFNIRYDNPADSLNNWKFRKSHVANMVKFHEFEILGTQEGLKHQLEDMLALLPGYAYVGVGRDDGKEAGEHSAIFFNTQRFDLLENGDFWLSEDSNKPTKGWDAVLPRICSWAKFKEKKTGFEFYFYNTHFDHVGEKAREESAKLILEKIEEKADQSPVLLSGDFNVDQHSESYKLLYSSFVLDDSFVLSQFNYGAQGTFNGFEINNTSLSRIDHLFVTKDFEVLKHGILTDTYRTDRDQLKEIDGTGDFPKEVSFYNSQPRYLSDHFPILAILKIKDL